MSLHPINILERYWKFTSFRGKQEAIINAVLAGEDVFALMPTGGGKSICFQIPALIKEGICIVISPLIALMKDQVENLNSKNIKALAITSDLKKNELDTILDNCIYGNYKFLYLSPERLQQELVQDRIKQMNVNLIAVDEAHCISQWGNDFRPAYSNIIQLRQLQPSVNIIALTATAKPNVVKDIINQLDFIKPKIFKQSFFRDNLSYIVLHEADKHYKLKRILNKYKGSSIIYVRNRRATIEVANFLVKEGISATFYHGGLSHKLKNDNMKAWMRNQRQVIVATNAFGMGIDKADVKTVIHLNLPESIESYFQEAGRAGRNGTKAFAIVLKNKNDESLVKHQFLNVLPDVNKVKMVYRKLCSFFQIPYGEGENTTYSFNFNTFCKTYNFNAILCYNALLILDRNSIIGLTSRFKNKVLLQFTVSNDSLFNYMDENPDTERIIKSILRSYGGVFDYETEINTNKMASKADVKEFQFIEVLERLSQDHIINLNISRTDAQVTFIEPREDDRTINKIASIIKQQNTLKTKQVNAVLDYVNNEAICKSMQLLNYFGETNLAPCGICSVCMAETKDASLNSEKIKERIIKLLQSGDLSSRALTEAIGCSANDTSQALKHLLEYQIIIITKTNTYKLSHL